MRQPPSKYTFAQLSKTILSVHEHFVNRSMQAVNVGLTLRNWLIGYYIVAFEQQGSARARYGEELLYRLSERLETLGLPRMEERELRRYRQFYLAYPQIRESVTPEFELPPHLAPIRESVTPESGLKLPAVIRESVTPELKNKGAQRIRESVTPESPGNGKRLIETLSFTHFSWLLQIEDPEKRLFYETEGLKARWTSRELKRQISSLLYERTALSRKRNRLKGDVQTKTSAIQLTLRDPYIFEFLGLRPAEVMDESKLELALLDKVQSFLIELGHGFCFEARQRHIRIGHESFYVDLVFYHRVLKCHVLVELKVDEFRHEHLGQLNTYVTWYAKHEMNPGDTPPIGLLLCTHQNHALVEYALAGLDNKLFVSRYQLALPKKRELQKLLEAELAEVQVSASPGPPRRKKSS